MSNQNEDLLNGMFAGDPNSTREFIKRFGGLIRYAIRSIRLRSDAIKEDDLINNAWLHLLDQDHKVLKQFRRKCSLPSYLYTVCRRNALDIAKRENIITGRTDDDAGLVNLAHEIFEKESFSEKKKKALSKVLTKLPPEMLLFIKMSIVDKCSVEEIMKVFGWKNRAKVYKTKLNIINKIRKEIRKLLNNEGENDDE